MLPSNWTITTPRTPNQQWNRKCSFCGIYLLTGERSGGFCCGTQGKYAKDVLPLPPLPMEFMWLANQPGISFLSRKLNLLFSFAAMETMSNFPVHIGVQGFLSIQGRVYHRIRPSHPSSGLRWLLYDGWMRPHMPHSAWESILPRSWTNAVSTALLRVNPFAQDLHVFSTLAIEDCPEAHITLEDQGTAEIAAIMHYDNTSAGNYSPRTMVIRRNEGLNIQVATTSRLWEPLAYPLFFPHGTLGWGLINGANDFRSGQRRDQTLANDLDAATTQIWHYRARLLREPRFEFFGRLTNEYLIDMWTREIDSRLAYIRKNQEQIRLQDAELMGLDEIPGSANVFLPSSFLGGRRWCADQIADALAIAAFYGNPTFFITITANPQWPEIRSRLRSNQTFADIPVVVARAFHARLTVILNGICKMFPRCGAPVYKLHVIEFQKRGLPHCHFLVKFPNDCVLPDDIDKIVSAEIAEDPKDAELVHSFLYHSHRPSTSSVLSACQRRSATGQVSCKYGYPHQLQDRTTIDVQGRPHYRRRHEGDEMVVPHCLPLIRAFNCHINFEVANTSHIFQYLFKYIHKGPDRARYSIGVDEPVDEIKDFWSGRYVSAGEAAWRILGFHITHKYPSVECLPVHLPGSRKHHQYIRTGGNQSTMSLLDRYFLRPRGNFQDHDGEFHPFANVTYLDYFRRFHLISWDEDHGANNHVYPEEQPANGQIRRRCLRRSLTHPHITRLPSFRPSQGEVFYLRVLLGIRPAYSYKELRTIEGVDHGTFQTAAGALGLFATETEAEYALIEGITSLRTPHQLRFLFAQLLVNDCIIHPNELWERYQGQLSYDYFLQHSRNQHIATQLTLEALSAKLAEFGTTLSAFGLEEPTEMSNEVANEIERWGSNPDELMDEVTEALSSFTLEQQSIFDEFVEAIEQNRPLCVFIDGKAGRGKSFLIQTIANYTRSIGKIAIITATSAFASLTYTGGRTTHSTFKVPVDESNEFLKSTVDPNSSRANLLRETAIIFWDEAPMANRAVMQCIDDLLRNLMKTNVPFGGKIFVCAGDFRQTCPVIRRGTRAQVVDASIKSSVLWDNFLIRRLTVPIRNASDPDFAEYVDSIGDGAGPEIPVKYLDIVHDIDAVASFAFPDYILNDPPSCFSRAILAPTNQQVDHYNDFILDKLPSTGRIYYAADSLKEMDDANVVAPCSALDYVAKQTPPGLAPYMLRVKPGGLYRLMRNLSIDRGMVKNTRCVVVDVGNRLVTIRVLGGPSGSDLDSEEILIPRITFTSNLSSSRYTLVWKQFPLAPAYATTFNSCQGLTLNRVAVDLTRPIFSHGQLYTALSRVRHRSHACVRLIPGIKSTSNVTYEELLL